MGIMGNYCCCRSYDAVAVAEQRSHVSVQHRQRNGSSDYGSASSSCKPEPQGKEASCEGKGRSFPLYEAVAVEGCSPALKAKQEPTGDLGDATRLSEDTGASKSDRCIHKEEEEEEEEDGSGASSPSRSRRGDPGHGRHIGPTAHRNALQAIAGSSLADLVASWTAIVESKKPVKLEEHNSDRGSKWLPPRWPVIVKKVVQEKGHMPDQPRLSEQYTETRPLLQERLEEARSQSVSVLYFIGQVSLSELEHQCRLHPGSVLIVQGLSGFNVVDLSAEGELVEAQRQDVLRICKATDNLLLNLTATDCAKVPFDRVDQLFDSSLPDGKAKDVLHAYRASSFGSFAASASRGKIKVTAKDGAATDGLIRSVNPSIGETVEKLQSFEMQLYRDAIPFCRGDKTKIEIFTRVMAAIEASASRSPEEYLTERTCGFGDPEAFNEMRNWCAAEITSAAYMQGGVLDGCVTPVYDDWTMHQGLRMLAGLQPLDPEVADDIEEHLGFVAECMKFLFLDVNLGEYSTMILSRIPPLKHIVFHDVGSDTGPDDFPACALLMALTKLRPETETQLLAVGGEHKYRALRTNLMRLLTPEVPGVSIAASPFLKGVSFPSPFVPVALVQTMATYAADVELLNGGGSDDGGLNPEITNPEAAEDGLDSQAADGDGSQQGQ